ncbi:MAG: hypothetical protein IPM23_01725 [Candidatus Melainabacteria bacterium]|nr:hypothetical protein [Candidatus Melainabacteria bacterium]
MTFRFFPSDSPVNGETDSSADNSLNSEFLSLSQLGPGKAARMLQSYEAINPGLPPGFPVLNPVFPTMIPDPIRAAETISEIPIHTLTPSPLFPTVFPDPIRAATQVAGLNNQRTGAPGTSNLSALGHMLVPAIATRPTGIF